MALTYSTLRKPANAQVVDPSTGRMREEWALYFDQLTTRLNSAVGELDVDYVQGPASSTDGNLASFDGATGKLLEDSGIASANVVVDADITDMVEAAAVLANDQFVVGDGGARGVKTVTAASARNLIGLDTDDDVTFHALTVHGTGASGDPGITVSGTSGNPKIEIGRVDGSASLPHIDFHSGATAVDYDARIIGSGGNGATGGGTLNIQAASLLFNNNSIPGVLLASGSVASAAALDIVLTSFTGFRALKFVLTSFIPATDDRELWMRFSTDGGSSFDATGYSWARQFVRDGNGNPFATVSGSSAQLVVLSSPTGGESVSNVTAEGGGHAEITLFNPAETGQHTRANWFGQWFGSTVTDTFITSGGGRREAAQDTDAVRFLFESGDIASGNYAVYGLI